MKLLGQENGIASEWMGQPEQLNAVVLRHYIDKFEFGGLRVDTAFRCVGRPLIDE